MCVLSQSKNYLPISGKLIFALLLVFSLPFITNEGHTQSLHWGIQPRLWGADMFAQYRRIDLIAQGSTGLIMAIGGGYENAYLYRQNGTHVNLPSTDMTATYSNLNFQINAGLKQEINWGLHVLRGFLLVKNRYEYHNPLWAPTALLFDSALPDRLTLFENALFTGLLLEKSISPEQAMEVFPLTYALQGSLHWAPRFLFNTISDYTRLSAQGKVRVQLLNRLMVQLYIAARIGVDTILGSSYPVYARTSIGRIADPYFTYMSALGGTVRGLAIGRFDGTTKLYTNFDVRVRFPVYALVYPVVTVFFDTGVSDYSTLDRRLHYADFLYTTGSSIALRIAEIAEIGYAIAYAFNEPDTERRLRHWVTLSSHF